jgi:hypothetical protein
MIGNARTIKRLCKFQIAFRKKEAYIRFHRCTFLQPEALGENSSPITSLIRTKLFNSNLGLRLDSSNDQGHHGYRSTIASAAS